MILLVVNKFWGYIVNVNSVDSCVGCLWLLYFWEKFVFEMGIVCICVRGRLWFIFFIYLRSYFCLLKFSYSLYLVRILECSFG